MAAAKRAGDTRDAVLVLKGQVESLDGRIVTHTLDIKGRLDGVDRQIQGLESRVGALEHGWVDRRHTGKRFDFNDGP